METLRVLVVSDDPLARTGLALLLGGQEGLTVAGQVGVDDDWPDARLEGVPDAAVWDLGLGTRFGLERLRGMGLSATPAVAVVADEIDAREALAAGARAALPRDADGESLAAALRAVVQGLVVLDESFAAALLGDVRDAPAAPPDLVESLTPREAEVLQLLTQGLPNKAIAQRLGISDHTVKFHVNAILGKLGVQSRGEAIVQAVRLGLVAL
jgi:two-component system nitrate/nitrite response regulator NarL